MGLPGEPEHPEVGVVLFQNGQDFCVVIGNADPELYAKFLGEQFCQFVIIAGGAVFTFHIDRRRRPGNHMQHPLITDFLESAGL